MYAGLLIVLNVFIFKVCAHVMRERIILEVCWFPFKGTSSNTVTEYKWHIILC